MNFSNLPQPFLVLAPMDDVTDTVFRQIVAGCAAPDLFFTEFVNVDGLQSPGRAKLLKKLQFTSVDTPLVAQLWGLKPENFRAVAQQIADGTLARELGLAQGVNFVGVDLNMGCPAKGEVQNGACAALMNNRGLAGEIIQATLDGAGGFPVSVKTRLGFNEIDLTWHEFLLRFKLNMLTIHGRTKREMSKVPAHWDEIGRVRELRDSLAPGTLIIGNGDVGSRGEAEKLAEQYGLDGIMIGRGIFHDLDAFAARASERSPKERLAILERHLQLYEQWGSNKPFHILRKFFKIYVAGWPGAAELRARLMEAADSAQVREILATSAVSVR
jgi:tRNA-dihydrouridine synthase